MRTTALLLAVLLLMSCQNKQSGSADEEPTTFTPTADSSLTERQVTRWLKANSVLDSLAIAYRDSFSVEDPDSRQAYQEQFREAQNQVCLDVGLVGGYREYAWVTEAMANPRNAGLRQAHNISAHE